MSDVDRDWKTTKALLQHFEDEWVVGNNPDPGEYLSRAPQQDRAALAASISQLRAEGLPDKRPDSLIENWMLTKAISGGVGAVMMLMLSAFGALLAFAPNLWAALVAVGFMLISGQFVTRVVLSMPAGTKQWCWSIATGFGLLGFFWVIIQLKP